MVNSNSLTPSCLQRRTPIAVHRKDDGATLLIFTLKQLCAELKVDPREARERLRLAGRDVKKNPELAKAHKPGHSWEWPKNSPALKEARAALSP